MSGYKQNHIKILIGLVLGGLAGVFLGISLATHRRASAQEKERKVSWVSRVLTRLGRVRRQTQARLAGASARLVSNWGNYPVTAAKLYTFETADELGGLLGQLDTVIPRGNGRCYGDSALAGQIISTMRYNRFLAFDEQQGLITCQAGVTLAEVLEIIVPRGWFLPVTPGTKFITVGGAIASDVHGKNQHKEGTFCEHVFDLEVMLSNGRRVRCSRAENEELFRSVCGGMGLTGFILQATFRLKPIETAYIRQESIRAGNLDQLMDLFEASAGWTYTMAWIDCLVQGPAMGRGILLRGEHALKSELQTEQQWRQPLKLKPKFKFNVPFYLPNFALNGLTAKLFNLFYYHRHLPISQQAIVDYDSFFYPLDVIHNWNRIYGKRGFTQYQFILPKAHSRAGFRALLSKIAQSGSGSFLAVLKLYGPQQGYIPFAMDGFSLALDFPITPGLFNFLDELDKLVLEYGGRLYLTKDARMSREMFLTSYPNAQAFIQKVQQLNSGVKFRSLQSDRIGITSWDTY